MLARIRPYRSPAHRAAWARFARINIYGLGLLALWSTVDVLLLPRQVTATVSSGIEGSALGLISTIGVGLALIVQPIAGRISDAWPGPDKRRPFIIAGTLLVLPGMALFGWSAHFVVLLLGFVLMQLATNIAQAAYQAYIPDLVKEDERGLASGLKNLLGVLGAALGLLAAQGLLGLGGTPWLVMGFLAAVMLTVGWLTLRWVPRIAADAGGSGRAALCEAADVKAMIREFSATLRERVTLRRAIAAQFLFMLGTYPAQRFLLLFLRERFGADAERIASVGGVMAILLAVTSAVVAGAASDAIGRRSVLMASVVAGGLGLVVFGFALTVPLAALGGGLIAIGLGAFMSVNWALMNDDLPPGKSAASLGVANFATAGAGTAAGLFGPLADGVNALLPQGTYQVVFGLAGAVAVTSLIPLRRLD